MITDKVEDIKGCAADGLVPLEIIMVLLGHQ